MGEHPVNAGPMTAMRPVQVAPEPRRRTIAWVPVLVGGVPVTAFVVILVVGLLNKSTGGDRDLLEVLLDGLAALSSWATSVLPFLR